MEFSSDDPVICSSPANQLDECKEDEGMKAVCELFDEVEGDKITECIIENSEACVNAGGDYSAKKISSDSEITLQSTSRSSG